MATSGCSLFTLFPLNTLPKPPDPRIFYWLVSSVKKEYYPIEYSPSLRFSYFEKGIYLPSK